MVFDLLGCGTDSARRRRGASALLTGLLLAGAGSIAAATGTAPLHAHLAPVKDLATEARTAHARGEPLVVLVTLPDCGYCEAVRRHYLGPQAAAGEIAARELDMSAATPIRDAQGRATTARDWARAQGIRFAPTVLFLDRHGSPAAPPLRGMQPDFYGAYLQQSLDKARAAIAGAAR